MPMLGDILAAAHDRAGAFGAWLEASDPVLMQSVAAAAAAAGQSPADFVRVAVADFARFASEEDWAMLTSRLRSGSDPGTVCLLAMLRWRVKAAAAQAPLEADEGQSDDRRT